LCAFPAIEQSSHLRQSHADRKTVSITPGVPFRLPSL
jgi:hypothetical protein